MPGALCDAARAEHEAETRRPGVVAAVLGPAFLGVAAVSRNRLVPAPAGSA
jgi:hypothetical protein